MSRREHPDALVIGAGMVGAAAALALAEHGRRVAIVEARAPGIWRRETPDLRVVALAPDNIDLLDRLGVWPAIRAERAQAYRCMRIRDAGSDDELRFDAAAAGRSDLGWIVENELVASRLWQALADHPGVRRYCPNTLLRLEQDDGHVLAELDDGLVLRARLLLAADGAGSPVRGLLGIECERYDYAQAGLVAYVETGLAHADTCYQRFLPGGPLAFLPFADGRSSIVWSLPADQAQRLLALDDAAFLDRLARAFDGPLGELRAVSARRTFPLRRQLAQRYADGRCLLIGDAAHVVHPLAGQGVNLGLRDVQALLRACEGQTDIGEPRRLQRLARERRSENAVAAHAFEGIHHVFSNDRLLPTLLRGPALGLANRLPPLKSMLIRRALGTG